MFDHIGRLGSETQVRNEGWSLMKRLVFGGGGVPPIPVLFCADDSIRHLLGYC